MLWQMSLPEQFMSYKINVGDRIPVFHARDQDGMEIDSDDLLGSPFVIYFYPKDDTPGCTKEACGLRDNMEQLETLNTLVLGVSPDSATSHNQFIKKYGLNFTLLTDENHELAKKFDVIEKNMSEKKVISIVRTTFFVDSAGVIRWIERPVSVEGHAERVVLAVEQNLR